MEKKLVYVDTCILSRIVDLRFSKSTAIAIDKLCDLDMIELVTSPKTLEEFINTINSKKKTALKLLYKLISKLQNKETVIYTPATWGSGRWGESVWGGGSTSEDPIYSKIKEIFDKDDTDHIYQAIKNDCKYFLTLDKRTILNPAKKYQNELDLILLDMEFVDPTDLINKLSK